MQFINIRELSRSTSKYVKLAAEETEIVITKNGQPCAVLLKIDGDELEDFILAKSFNLESDFNLAKKEYESGKTTNARDLLNNLKSPQ